MASKQLLSSLQFRRSNFELPKSVSKVVIQYTPGCSEPGHTSARKFTKTYLPMILYHNPHVAVEIVAKPVKVAKKAQTDAQPAGAAAPAAVQPVLIVEGPTKQTFDFAATYSDLEAAAAKSAAAAAASKDAGAPVGGAASAASEVPLVPVRARWRKATHLPVMYDVAGAVFKQLTGKSLTDPLPFSTKGAKSNKKASKPKAAAGDAAGDAAAAAVAPAQ